jgi:hypothetical protein
MSRAGLLLAGLILAALCVLAGTYALAQGPAPERWVTHLQRVGDTPAGRAIGLCDLSNDRTADWMPRGRPLPTARACIDYHKGVWVFRRDDDQGRLRVRITCRGPADILYAQRGSLKSMPLCNAEGRAIAR